MSTKAPRSIDKTPLPRGLNWKALVEEGRALLHLLAGDDWTDFNESDPGVTLFEALVYALTDLGHRTQHSIPDLLTRADGTLDRWGACLYTPAQVFPTAPVTSLDLRKVLMDEFPNLANVWIHPSGGSGTPGRYQVWVLPARRVGGHVLALSIEQCLSRYRTLGDFFEPVEVVVPEQIVLKVQLRIEVDAEPVQLLLAAQASVTRALCPPVTFLPRTGPLAPAESSDELYDGPLLAHGVLPDSALGPPRTWEQLPALISDALLSTEGILEVASLKVSSLAGAPPSKDMPLAFEWNAFDAGNDLELIQGNGSSGTRFDPSKVDPKWKKPLPLSPPRGFASLDLEAWWAAEVPAGTFVDPARYDPVQEDLPPLYGLQKNGLPANAPPSRVAQVKQLRAFLFVFEQILANDFAQLAATPKLLSWRRDASPFHWQPLYELAGAEAILPGTLLPTPDSDPTQMMDAWVAYQKDAANPYAGALSAIVAGWGQTYARTEDILDHLLARFAEAWPRLSWKNFETSEQKRRYLEALPRLSTSRHLAFDLERARSERRITAENASVLEKKVNLLLAAGPRGPLEEHVPRAELAQGADASYRPYPGRSYFLVELPLLLPPASLGPLQGPASPPVSIRRDFFTLRIAHVLTNWTFYEMTPGFRAYVDSFIRQSAPAHLDHRFIWLCGRAMKKFTALISAWYADGLPPLQLYSQDEEELLVQPAGSAWALVHWLERALSGGERGGECIYKSGDRCEVD